MKNVNRFQARNDAIPKVARCLVPIRHSGYQPSPISSRLVEPKYPIFKPSPTSAMALNPPSTARALRSALLRLPIQIHQPPPFRSLPLFSLRFSSTITTPNTPIAPAPASLPPTSIPRPSSIPPTSTSLPWNEYLQLRRKRRHYNLLFSLATALCTTGAGIYTLGQQNLENMNLFGLDPFIVLGLATMASGAVGWLLGPFIGNGVFGLVWRKSRAQIAAVSINPSLFPLSPCIIKLLDRPALLIGRVANLNPSTKKLHPYPLFRAQCLYIALQKDRDFYERIKRHRVDPSSQSYSNPVPDYYGEKIGSVKEFRNWMKDQRAYNKKRQSFL